MSKSILFYFKKPQTNQIMFFHFKELSFKTTLFPSVASQDPVKCYSLHGGEFRICSWLEGWVSEEWSAILFIK